MEHIDISRLTHLERFSIKTATLDLVEHAQQSYPNECCGVIVKSSENYRYIRSENLSKEPHNSFLIEQEILDKYKDSIHYIAHSHVNGDATPSDNDKANSERSGIPYLIVSVPEISFQTYRPCGYEQSYEGRFFLYGANDCFTLVRDFYKREFGIELEDKIRNDTMWWENKDTDYSSKVDLESMGFVEVSEPKYGDVLLMKLKSLQPNHMAIWLEPNLIMHQYYGRPSLKEAYGWYWKKNTDHIMRHKEMIDVHK